MANSLQPITNVRNYHASSTAIYKLFYFELKKKKVKDYLQKNNLEIEKLKIGQYRIICIG